MKVGKKELCSYFIALPLMQKGYRRINLKSYDGTNLIAELLVKINFD